MASYANIAVDQGASFETMITLEDSNQDPIDLDGYLVHGQVRRTYKSDISFEFSVTIANSAEGVIGIALTPETTSAMKAGRYVYDVFAQNGTKIFKVVEGLLEVVPSVTRIENSNEN